MYILISYLILSVFEIFVLVFLVNSNFKRIGLIIEGIFFLILDKEFLNGWEYELFNEVYLDLKGKNYENIGILFDYKLDYLMNKDNFLD